jgi:hypothetical protein
VEADHRRVVDPTDFNDPRCPGLDDAERAILQSAIDEARARKATFLQRVDVIDRTIAKILEARR